MGTDAGGNLVYIDGAGSTTQLNRPEIHTAAMSAPPSLVGSEVTGSFMYAGEAQDYYDPGDNPMYECYTGGTVPISETATEFGFAGGEPFTATADFTDSTLSVANLVDGGSASWTQTFTDSLFAGATLTEVPGADTFPAGRDVDSPGGGLVSSLSGDTITLTWAGLPFGDESGVYNDEFNITTVPEPGTWALTLFAGVVLLGYAARARASFAG
jgi:hypothetical protein